MLLEKDEVLRFQYNDIMGDMTKEGTRAAEQLGEGRAHLPLKTVRARMSLIEAMQKYGIAIITGAPAQPDVGKVIADAVVGAVETTAFGYKFVIKQVDDPHNLAFDSIALQQHSDFTYLKKVPDVALFHCIQNADIGGDSLWVDGYAVAEELRRVDPAAFDVLVSTPVRFVDLTDKWDMRATHPTIELNGKTGQVERIHFNERTRDSWRQAAAAKSATNDEASLFCSSSQPSAVSPQFYAALRKFEALVDDARGHVNTPLKPGDVALFDNARVMHSRTAFTGNRHMEGSYISWESVQATWRALRWQVKEKPYEYCGRTVGGAK
jgi:gamma-butyrobetaine dioxygenase